MKLVMMLVMMGTTVAYQSGLVLSYALTRHLTTRGRVDDSHNHVHATEVLFWANEIMRAHPVSRRDADAAGHCALLHDLLDGKYEIPGAGDAVRHHLVDVIGYSLKTADDMIRVMTSISYHKTMINDNGPVFPDWLEDSDWKNVFHITRDADLLASYNMARMIEFRRHFRPWLHPEEIADEVIELYDERMDTLLERSAFHHDASSDIAGALERVCRLRRGIIHTAVHLPSLDILRIINHLDPYMVIRDHELLSTLD